MSEKIDTTPPAKVSSNAQKGLDLHNKFSRGGTDVGIARARDLKNRKSLSAETIGRMVNYFTRHAVDKKGKDFGNDDDPSAGYIAWLLWGGDEGRDWAERVKKKLDG